MSWTDSDNEDYDDDYDPRAEEFGDLALVQAVDIPDVIQRLLAQGKEPVANAVCAAADAFKTETMGHLLAAGGDPNLAMDRTPATSNLISVTDYLPHFEDDRQLWPPLLFAICGYVGGDDERERRRAKMTSFLLDHGADLYTLYSQPLLRHEGRTLFPGRCSLDEGSDGTVGEVVRANRCVVHAILEDSQNVTAILEHRNGLNLEHRDPTGRTLLHAVCRNSVGADISVEYADMSTFYTASHMCNKVESDLLFNDATTPSIFETFVTLGADVLAVDNDGKHVLHHLFEASDTTNPDRPPHIRHTLKYITTNFPSLINQPDHKGNYPMHTALQCLRRYPHQQGHAICAQVESYIDDLLAAGADAHARDSRGNTALHYIADDGLCAHWGGDFHRRLFRLFLDRKVDINIRNDAGRTALELAMDDDGSRERLHAVNRGDNKTPTDVMREVFKCIDEAGVNWQDRDRDGQTLLHIVAKHAHQKAGTRFKYVLEKSVDPNIKDNNGKTAADIARQTNNRQVLDLLDGKPLPEHLCV